MSSGYDWRISLTEAGLAKGSIANYNIPAPDTAVYRDNSTEVSQSEGGQALHGYRNVEILWERLSAEQASILRGFIDDAKASTSRVLYLTIDRGDASAPGEDWIDVSGRPYRRADLSQEGPIVSRLGVPTYQSFVLFVNNLTIVNDPSSYTT